MRILIGAALLLVIGAADYLARIAPVATGYAAKILCSAVFVSGRDPASVAGQEFTIPEGGLLRIFSTHVDVDRRTIAAHLFGTNTAWAVWRPGLGCALAGSSQDAQRLAQEHGPLPGRAFSPWRVSKKNPGLEDVLDEAFSDPGTRAAVIVRGGTLLGERYASGFSEKTPLLGWSMTKGVTNALVGIRLAELGVGVESKKLLPEWSGKKETITIENLLRMRSGLRFREVYSVAPSDVSRMLFARRDASGFAAGMPLEHPPGEYWSYSSGTTNILMRLLRSSFPDEAAYRAFPRVKLFDRIGAQSVVMETDAFGTFVGSSFMYANARDWARFGRLYLNDGVWEGDRILPEGWIQRSLRPAGGGYGSHVWVDLPAEVGGPEDPAWADAFYFLGHEGQSVSVIPSKNLVVVRLGLNKSGTWNQAKFLRAVFAAL
ncbi:MAG: serine hydrolase [Elusimicrobia bacterium]|nr:MAG: serine hydrolase [Elusimicrobiota bacterium]